MTRSDVWEPISLLDPDSEELELAEGKGIVFAGNTVNLAIASQLEWLEVSVT